MTMSLSLRMFYCNIEVTQVNSRINSKYEMSTTHNTLNRKIADRSGFFSTNRSII